MKYVYTEKAEKRASELGLEERKAGTLAMFGREPLQGGSIAIAWKKKGYVVEISEKEDESNMERTAETIRINNALEIVYLDGDTKFKHPLGYARPKGYCFRHPDKGYYAVNDTVPYMPCGGRMALEAIMEQGGFLNFDNATWLQPLKRTYQNYQMNISDHEAEN